MHALDGRVHAHDLLLTQAFSFTLTARVRALSISLPPSYKRSQTLSFSCFGLQAKAWKAGHKRECEEAKWLQAAFDGGHKSARLHLAHLAFTAGEEDTALARLKEHLSCVCKTDVTLVPGVGKCGEWKLKCSRASSVPYEVRRPARLPRRTIFSRCICRCSRMRARLPLHTLLHTQVSR